MSCGQCPVLGVGVFQDRREGEVRYVRHLDVEEGHVHGGVEVDTSEIAKKYGGGGHKGASGFNCDILPWLIRKEFIDENKI